VYSVGIMLAFGNTYAGSFAPDMADLIAVPHPGVYAGTNL
jgi:hypothetical protein